MANFWQVMTALSATGASASAQEAAKEAKLQRKELEKQTELIRKSTLTPEQLAAEERAERERIATEERAKTKRGIEIGVIFGVLVYLGLWFSYPVAAAIVTAVVIAIIVVIVLIVRKNKEDVDKRTAKKDGPYVGGKNIPSNKEGKSLNKNLEEKSNKDLGKKSSKESSVGTKKETPVSKKKNKQDKVGLIWTIVSLVFFWFPFVGFISAGIGMYFSIIFVRREKSSVCAIIALVLASISILWGFYYSVLAVRNF